VRLFLAGGILLLLFCLLTVLLLTVDVRPVGPLGSEVGLSGLNAAVFSALGTSETFLEIGELLGLFALLVVGGTALFGAVSLVRVRSIRRIDRGLLLLGGFYAAVLALYGLFEVAVVNCRPVMTDGVLEASYPSSHTMLAVFVFVSGWLYARRYLAGHRAADIALGAAAFLLSALTALSRLLAGVHWLTDVLGGLLLSLALVLFYAALLCRIGAKGRGSR
ncbi:MAG: phosphatase PAP2 family protein, partial [Clostridia bacterium]|nr:phosphatase PAP2 family protein [Clostridia bacterium]